MTPLPIRWPVAGPWAKRLQTGLFLCLWLVTASATLMESYAYSYAGLVLVLYGGYGYLTMRPRPAFDWQTWLCLGWGSYVLGRFLLQYLLAASHPTGDAELLYAMPLVFPSLGFAIFLCWAQMERVVAAYFGMALLVLALTTHYLAIFHGETARPLIQHNSIHGAVCCGVILIGAIFWLIDYRTSPKASKAMAVYAAVVGPLVCALCLFCIYGAKSKGVWLALGVALPWLLVCAIRSFRSRSGLLITGVVAAMLAFGVYAVHHSLESTAGATLDATIGLSRQIAAGMPPGAAVSARIDNLTTPHAMDERLQLWSNAWELVTDAPLFGLGSAWEGLWHHSRYTAVDYDAMHNGYLEILVRYGLSGIVAAAVMMLVFLRDVRRAARLGLISPAVFRCYLVVQIFFAVTLLSNSNNRLVIGESIILLSFAFALACNLKRRAALAAGNDGLQRSG